MDISKLKQDWSDDELTIVYNNIGLKKEAEEVKLTPITIKDLKARLKDKLANDSLQSGDILDKIGTKYSTPRIIQTFSLATKPSDNKTNPLIANSTDLNNSGLITRTPEVKPRNADKNSLQNRNVLNKIGMKYSVPKIIQTFSLASKPSDNKTKPMIAHRTTKKSGLITSAPQIKPRNANKNIVLNKHAKISQLPARFSSRTSLNKLLKPSYVRPNNTTPLSFDGAKFLRTQVHSNPFLQSLLKDIVRLNNKKDDEDDDTINREIAKLRSKNNLPSLNPEDPMEVEFLDFDYLEDSEDDSFSYCNSKSSENYGKDSGYDYESPNSESLEEDTRSEIHENGSGHAIVAVEPEYVDLDHYFESNTNSSDSPETADSDVIVIEEAVSNETIPKLHENNELECSHCLRTFKNKLLYNLHAKNHKSCFKAALSQLKNTPTSPTVLPCKKCGLTFVSQFVLDHHYKKFHSIKQYPNRIKHRIVKKESPESDSVIKHRIIEKESSESDSVNKHRIIKKESSESDGVEIIELDSD